MKKKSVYLQLFNSLVLVHLCSFTVYSFVTQHIQPKTKAPLQKLEHVEQRIARPQKKKKDMRQSVCIKQDV